MNEPKCCTYEKELAYPVSRFWSKLSVWFKAIIFYEKPELSFSATRPILKPGKLQRVVSHHLGTLPILVGCNSLCSSAKNY